MNDDDAFEHEIMMDNSHVAFFKNSSPIGLGKEFLNKHPDLGRFEDYDSYFVGLLGFLYGFYPGATYWSGMNETEKVFYWYPWNANTPSRTYMVLYHAKGKLICRCAPRLATIVSLPLICAKNSIHL